MNKLRNSCPTCGTPRSPKTAIRYVQVWRDIVRDEKFTVPVATCRKCGQKYELRISSGNRKAIGGSYIFLLAMGTLLLSLLDGFFSLQLVALGAKELNPLLNRFLDYGPVHFVLAKYGLTSLGVVLLALYHSRRFFFGRLTGRHVLLGTQVVFALVTCYQAMLLWAGGNEHLELAQLTHVIWG